MLYLVLYLTYLAYKNFDLDSIAENMLKDTLVFSVKYKK